MTQNEVSVVGIHKVTENNTKQAFQLGQNRILGVDIIPPNLKDNKKESKTHHNESVFTKNINYKTD